MNDQIIFIEFESQVSEFVSDNLLLPKCNLTLDILTLSYVIPLNIIRGLQNLQKKNIYNISIFLPYWGSCLDVVSHPS